MTNNQQRIQQANSYSQWSIPVEWNIPMELKMFLGNPDFHLTGSRFFNPEDVAKNTDWDFFAQHSIPLTRHLKNLGFYDIGGYGYECDEIDKGLITVLRYTFEEGEDKVQIDIQLCRDVQERLQLRDCLKEVDWQSIPKKQRSEVWDLARTLLKSPAKEILKDLLVS